MGGSGPVSDAEIVGPKEVTDPLLSCALSLCVVCVCVRAHILCVNHDTATRAMGRCSQQKE